MLTSLFPSTHGRYTRLPVLGDALENLCSWLESRGYPTNAIIRRMRAAPFLDQCLQQRHVQSLCRYTAEQLRACFPREDRWTPQIAYALGRSLVSYLEERGGLTSTPPTASERLIDGYRNISNGYVDSPPQRSGDTPTWRATSCDSWVMKITCSVSFTLGLSMWSASSPRPARGWGGSRCRR
jgi:hypothetical protein